MSGRGGGRGGGMSSMRAYDRSADGGVAGGGGGGGGRGGGGGGGRGPNRYRKPLNGNFIAQRGDGGGGADAAPQLEAQRRNDEADAALGYPPLEDGERLGWLLNFGPASVEDRECAGRVLSAVDLYFQAQDGSKFKARVPFAPYFYVVAKPSRERDVEAWLRRRFDARLRDVERVEREDLGLRNHLSGIKRTLLRVSCWNVRDLTDVRRELQPLADRQKTRAGGMADAYAVLAEQRAAEAREAAALAGGGMGLLSMSEAFAAAGGGGGGGSGGGGGNGGGNGGAGGSDPSGEDIGDWILDLREYDVLYPIRFAIDTDVRAGHWYAVRATGGRVSLRRRADLVQRADPVVCAWDIEATKLPLQFPDAESDQVFMISYMLDRKGHLIVNREVVGGDVEAFEYTPKPEFEGPFEVHSCADEAALLRRWFDHMREVKPAIYVTYNGDFFDFPFMAVSSWRSGSFFRFFLGGGGGRAGCGRLFFFPSCRGLISARRSRSPSPPPPLLPAPFNPLSTPPSSQTTHPEQTRAAKHGMDLYAELGFRAKGQQQQQGGAGSSAAAANGGGEVVARAPIHMDCLHWVNRDSYLPQGSRGLKAVTKAKLGYDPVEVAPEDMVRLAREQPQAMASYSVSDAVATYYLYMT